MDTGRGEEETTRKSSSEKLTASEFMQKILPTQQRSETETYLMPQSKQQSSNQHIAEIT